MLVIIGVYILLHQNIYFANLKTTTLENNCQGYPSTFVCNTSISTAKNHDASGYRNGFAK